MFCFVSIGWYAARDQLRSAKKEYEKTEDDLKSLQSVGQIVGEVLSQLEVGRGTKFSFPLALFWNFIIRSKTSFYIMGV